MSYSAAVLALNPYLYWKMGEGSGTNLADSGSGGHAGTLAGAETLGEPKIGQADGTSIRFHGTSGENAGGTTAFANTTVFTFSCLIRFNTLRTNAVNAVCQILSEANFMVRVGDSGADKRWQVTAAGGFTSGDASHVAATGTDYHVVVIMDGVHGTLYINGVQALQFNATGTVNAGTFKLPWEFGDGRESDCWVQHAALWNSALTPANVATLYSAFSTPPHPASHGSDLQGELNRLASTDGLGPAAAANAWAGTSGLSLVAALNTKAGNAFGVWKDVQGVCNQIAGTDGLGAPGALQRIP